jgi:5-methylcytosine-specific restriction endonuclease McrA
MTDFQPDKRRAMTRNRKRRIHAAWEGRCWYCGEPVELEGPTVVYDHVIALWIKGSDADEEIGPIHADPCNKIKTARDLKKIAKIKRLIKREAGEKKPPRLMSRGFTHHLSRKFSGQVVPRAPKSGRPDSR